MPILGTFNRDIPPPIMYEGTVPTKFYLGTFELCIQGWGAPVACGTGETMSEDLNDIPSTHHSYFFS